MSSIHWKDETKLIQRFREHTADLGFIRKDSETDAYNLWLYDTTRTFLEHGGEIYADSFSSLEEAKNDAPSLPITSFMHGVWINWISKQLEMSTGRAAKELCRIIGGRNNLVGTDFADGKAWKIKRPFAQDPEGGYLIQFAISHHAIGKLSSPELQTVIETLLGKNSDGT